MCKWGKFLCPVCVVMVMSQEHSLSKGKHKATILCSYSDSDLVLQLHICLIVTVAIVLRIEYLLH